MRINIQTLNALGAASLLALALATGCSSNDRSTGQAINDKMTAHNVNSALSHDAEFKFPDVNVSVYNGNAQLTGFVDTEAQRQRAAQIASGVQGVTQVLNEITIKPPPTGRAAIRDVNEAPPPAPPPSR
jgi:osmotically-inducible protein OsmY